MANDEQFHYEMLEVLFNTSHNTGVISVSDAVVQFLLLEGRSEERKRYAEEIGNYMIRALETGEAHSIEDMLTHVDGVLFADS